MNDAEYEEIELGGEPMGKPSGLLLHDGLLYVVDYNALSFVCSRHKASLCAHCILTLNPKALVALVLGPDDRIYFNVPGRGEIYRINHNPHEPISCVIGRRLSLALFAMGRRWSGCDQR